MKGWYFADKPIPPNNEWVENWDKPLQTSKLLIDALPYAEGSIVCRVICDTIVDQDNSTVFSHRRKILWTLEADFILKKFGDLYKNSNRSELNKKLEKMVVEAAYKQYFGTVDRLVS